MRVAHRVYMDRPKSQRPASRPFPRPGSPPRPIPRPAVANPAPERSVYRYFDLADSFVQILVKDAGGLALPERPGMGRAGYRRMVIEACMPELRGDVEQALTTLFPDDPMMVEDLLYQLCVEINPSLDIHEVRLSVDPESQTRSAAPPEEPPKLLERLRARARGLDRRLGQDVIGQEAAVAAVVQAMRKAAVGLAPEGRPLASFLFTGRTGTGKTELARTLARELFAQPGESRGAGLVRIDCSEFALAHDTAKLIGSPPGYVGHEAGGQLTAAVAARPESVVLFDEVEKAHPRMHNLLLQVLEEGALTDSKGQRVSFERAVVIMTSNAGAREMIDATRTVGFGGCRALDRGALETITEQALGRAFSPELLGRMDEHVLFEELSPKVVERIAARKLLDLARRTRRAGAVVAFTPAVARWVAERGYSPESGAREVRRVLQREVEPGITERLMEGLQGLLRVRVRGGALVFEVEA
jgi:ATP-dependent Clp protease ATP-binding subunit ClpA